MTLRNKYIAACLRHNFTLVAVGMFKHVCYYDAISGYYYFIGRHGGVRRNKQPVIRGSVSVRFGDHFLRMGKNETSAD